MHAKVSRSPALAVFGAERLCLFFPFARLDKLALLNADPAPDLPKAYPTSTSNGGPHPIVQISPNQKHLRQDLLVCDQRKRHI